MDMDTVDVEENAQNSGDHHDPQLQQQTKNPWPHLNDFILFKSKFGEKLVFECRLCFPKKSLIKAHMTSLNNLKQHIRRMHPVKYAQFDEKIRAGSTRGKTKSKTQSSKADTDIDISHSPSSSKSRKILRQQNIGDSFGAMGSVTQASVDRCMVNFFVTNMIPLHVVESDTFNELVKTLNPSKSTFSRRTLGRRIVDSHIELKQNVIE